MQQRSRNRIVGVAGTVVLLVLATAGVVALRGGIAEHGNASALNDPDSDFVPVTGTVAMPPAAAQASGREWSQMSVRYRVADGQRIKTMVWTRRDNKDFDKGQRVDLEYVAQHPSAARLPGNQGGEAEPWRTLIMGIAILAAVTLVVVGVLSQAVSGLRRRAKT